MLDNLLNKTKWQVIFLASVIALLYFRSLSYEFIGLDEQSLLIGKSSFNKELSNIPKAFTQHVFQTDDYVGAPGSLKFYRPMLTVSFIIDSQFIKEEAGQNEIPGQGFSFFHFSNILYHFIAVIGLLFVLLRLNIAPPLSFFFTLIFAVHPLLAQAIAWIPGRNDSIASGFILWSFYFLLNYFSRPSGKDLFLHLLLFAGALFTKENTVVFPVLCSFFAFSNNGKTLAMNKKVILAVLYLLTAILWFYIRKSAVGEIENSSSLSGYYYAFLKNFPLGLQYIQKTLLPVNLAVMASVQDTNYGWVVLALALIGTGIYFTKKIPWKEISFGLLWFFLFLLPTLLFSYFEGMEHRSYLPVIGLLFVLIRLDPVQELVKHKNRMTGVFGTIILIFSLITFTRLPVFSSELHYWENAYETSAHSAVVCRDYGVILTKMGDYPNAEKAYLEGIKRDPKASLLHYNLGIMYFRMNRLGDAKAQLAKELEINTTNFMIYHVLGVIYKQENKPEEASMMWEQAVEINPNFVESYKELLSFYAQRKDTVNFLRCRNAIEKKRYRIVDKEKQK